ncbi:hypothetical protein BIW11_12892 [Tropilaelaps mercedesae]|uniref:Uncharacterized protein n=1 Tax=Tropilaelaps mercedesae TaxID=418985 RepID=A0A1V9X4Q1_9ACAR|nr:hypothetical protein BIW11_12892 [Tropilaelaps mercedesae]
MSSVVAKRETCDEDDYSVSTPPARVRPVGVSRSKAVRRPPANSRFVRRTVRTYRTHYPPLTHSLYSLGTV